MKHVCFDATSVASFDRLRTEGELCFCFWSVPLSSSVGEVEDVFLCGRMLFRGDRAPRLLW